MVRRVNKKLGIRGRVFPPMSVSWVCTELHIHRNNEELLKEMEWFAQTIDHLPNISTILEIVRFAVDEDFVDDEDNSYYTERDD